MKTLFTFSSFIFSILLAFGQTSFSDDFEDYSPGDYLAQESEVWSTWTNQPGTIEDAIVVSDLAASGSNSVHFTSTLATGGPQDVILPFGEEHTQGIFTLSMQMYIAEDKNAYFNFQADEEPGEIWTIEVNAVNGIISVTEGSEILSEGLYLPATWFECRIEANLSLNYWAFYIDDELVGNFTNSVNRVASANFYPINNSSFWLDNVSFDWQSFEIPALNLSAIGISDIGSLGELSYSPRGLVRNNGTQNINSFDVELTSSAGTISQNIANIELQPGEEFTVDFDNSLIISSGIQNIQLSLSNINDAAEDDYSEDDQFILSINLVAAAPGKHAVVEEGTGTWCQFCPRGAVLMDRLEALYNDNFVGIAVHNNDPMTVPVYDTGLGLNAFPAGKVDRFPQIGDVNFESQYIQRMTVAPKANVSVGAQYNENSRLLEIAAAAEMLSMVSGNYRLAVVITEDEVTGTGSGYNQANVFAGGDEEVGGYEDLPDPVPASMMVYEHVARRIMPDFDGAENVFPDNLLAGETYGINVFLTLPANWDENKINVIAMLLSPNNRVDNAYKASISQAIENGYYDSGNLLSDFSELPQPDANIKLYPNPTNQNSFVELDLKLEERVSIEIFTTDGRQVAAKEYGVLHGVSRLPIRSQNFEQGLYLVKIQIGNTQITEKLLVN